MRKILTAAFALVLSSAVFSAPAEGVKAAKTTKEKSKRDRAMKAQKDPATGELVEADVSVLPASKAAQTRVRSAVPSIVRLPSGAEAAALDKSFMHAVIATKDRSGKVTLSHADGETARKAAPRNDANER